MVDNLCKGRSMLAHGKISLSCTPNSILVNLGLLIDPHPIGSINSLFTQSIPKTNRTHLNKTSIPDCAAESSRRWYELRLEIRGKAFMECALPIVWVNANEDQLLCTHGHSTR